MNRVEISSYLMIVLLLLNSCEAKQNILTEEEVADGWVLFLMGKP